MNPLKTLPGQLLILTILFVMLAEVLIFVPSVGRYRLDYLKERISAGYLAGLALEAASENPVSKELRDELLHSADVFSVTMRREDRKMLVLMGDEMQKAEAEYVIENVPTLDAVLHAIRVLTSPPRTIMIKGMPRYADENVDVVLDEAPLKAEMIDYGIRILGLSIVISVFSAGLVYIALYFLMVRPMRRITQSMLEFREDPEDAARVIKPRRGHNEIAVAESSLAAMQGDVRSALKQQARLAALGQAVAKINHDLRNILASAQLVSDRLVESEDPGVQRLAPKLISSIDQAIALATNTLKFGQAEEAEPEKKRVPLKPMITDLEGALGLGAGSGIRLFADMADDVTAYADPDQLFRILLNLCRNAAQALETSDGGGTITVLPTLVNDMVRIDVIDTGPGLPETARNHLFEAFVGSARAGGTGLGLAISRELARAQGGDLALEKTGPDGTTFRITLPD